MYYVYLVKTSQDTLYCGYTNDLYKRINNHNSDKRGAKYTRTRQPVILVYYEQYDNLSAALKREHQIKKLNRSKKLKMIQKFAENHPKYEVIN